MNYFHETLPKIGQKFVAPYQDGTAADLFQCIGFEGGEVIYFDADGNKTSDLEGQGYLFWLPIPDDFTLWFEGCDK